MITPILIPVVILIVVAMVENLPRPIGSICAQGCRLRTHILRLSGPKTILHKA